MTPTLAQEKAIQIAVSRYRAGEKYTVIAGYAGVGKSESIKFIISALDIDPAFICYCTPTGKAAEVLRRKGCPNAMTIHKLLYEYRPRKDGTFIRTPRGSLEYRLVVCDEASMIGQSMIDLLLSHRNVYVIFCGDPFQLEPIQKDDMTHILDNPHIFLSEVLRQALDSDIIRLSMDIRAGKPLADFRGTDVMVLPKKELSEGMLTWASEILCGTNAMRKTLNEQTQALEGFTNPPEEGMKLICGRNYWDYMVDGEPLINGTVGTISNLRIGYERTLPPWVLNGLPLKYLLCDFTTETGKVFHGIKIDYNMLFTEKPAVGKDKVFKLSESARNKLPLEFAWASALTTHRAQGSSWPNILYIEERFPFDKLEHLHHAYVACTRAEDKLVIIRK